MHPDSTRDPLLEPLRQHLSRPRWQNLWALVVTVQLARTGIGRQLALFFPAPSSSASCYRRLTRILAWERETVWKTLAPVWVRAILTCFAKGRNRWSCSWTGPGTAIAVRAAGSCCPWAGARCPWALWLAPPE